MSSGIAKFYNKMPFEIKMRKIWLPKSPPVIIPPGGIIEGPYDLLSEYQFLQLIPVDFHRVESMTQNNKFEYKDELLPENNNLIIKHGTVVQVEQTQEMKEPEKINETKIELKEQILNITSNEMPFDVNTVNWLTVKIDQLEQAAKCLNIDISNIKELKPKERKWALVKVVKDATINKQQ